LKSTLKTISSTFYKQLLHRYSCAKKLQSQTVAREKLRKTLAYEKGAMMKSTPGVNFFNIQQATFTLADPESAKKTVKLSVFFF